MQIMVINHIKKVRIVTEDEEDVSLEEEEDEGEVDRITSVDHKTSQESYASDAIN